MIIPSIDYARKTCVALTMPDGTFWEITGIQKMFVVCEWIEKERYTHPDKFATYHEANERAKEIGPACFPQLETK
jgi:hypothetical protein